VSKSVRESLFAETLARSTSIYHSTREYKNSLSCDDAVQCRTLRSGLEIEGVRLLEELQASKDAFLEDFYSI